MLCHYQFTLMAKGFAPIPPPNVSTSFKRFKRTILDELKGLDDPRNKREPKHLLSDIVTIAILATLCGADNMVAVETYGREKQDWLASFLELPYGIPSHDTFSRVFAQIDPEQFHGFFLRWVQQLTVQLDIKIINLDGKTARGSYDRETKIKALHSVTAWAAEHHLVLAQQRVDEKSNEITAIPELLELLDVEGTIITIDAMGTQTEIAAQIIRNGGDYILALKGNQGNLHKGVKTFFDQAIAKDWSGILTFLLSFTFDFFGQPLPEANTRIAPYLGGGLSLDSGEGDTVGLLLSAGLDIPLSANFTANTALNVKFLDDTAVGLVLGVGYNF